LGRRSREKGSPAGLETAAHYHHYRFTADAEQNRSTGILSNAPRGSFANLRLRVLFLSHDWRRQVQLSKGARTQITSNGVDIKVLQRDKSRRLACNVCARPGPRHILAHMEFFFHNLESVLCLELQIIAFSAVSRGGEREMAQN
jgi:hypothetical protein